jgi:hypothetical protein
MKRFPIYQQLLIASFAFTAFSGGTAAHLASQPQITPQQSELFQTCKKLFEGGVLGVGGLLVVVARVGRLPDDQSSHSDDDADQDDDNDP